MNALPWFATTPELYVILAFIVAMPAWEAYRILRRGTPPYWPFYALGLAVLILWVEMLWRNDALFRP